MQVLDKTARHSLIKDLILIWLDKPNNKMIQDPHYIFPGEHGFKGDLLDRYLAAGYYRIYHMLFTTNHTAVDAGNESLPVFWLRTIVKNIQENNAAATIRKKCAAFSVTYKKAAITTEIETLYTAYFDSLNFQTSPTCSDCLHDSRLENPFDSWMIEIRDGDLLIAAGYFDKGKNAITGILNFYHPDYKKYSPGKYLMLKKIDYARENAISFYYTGYLSTAISKFDYKLFPDAAAIEVFLPVEKSWQPYRLLGKALLKEYYALHFIE